MASNINKKNFQSKNQEILNSGNLEQQSSTFIQNSQRCYRFSLSLIKAMQFMEQKQSINISIQDSGLHYIINIPHNEAQGMLQLNLQLNVPYDYINSRGC